MVIIQEFILSTIMVESFDDFGKIFQLPDKRFNKISQVLNFQRVQRRHKRLSNIVFQRAC